MDATETIVIERLVIASPECVAVSGSLRAGRRRGGSGGAGAETAELARFGNGSSAEPAAESGTSLLWSGRRARQPALTSMASSSPARFRPSGKPSRRVFLLQSNVPALTAVI